MKITIVAALTQSGVIGRDGTLPWPPIPEDMRRFRNITMGKAVIVGRRTWQSLPGPLDGRACIVLSRTLGESPDYVAQPTWEDAVMKAGVFGQLLGGEHAYVIGGAEVYRAALEDATHAKLTIVHRQCEGDARMPGWPETFASWAVRSREDVLTKDSEGGEVMLTFLDLERGAR